MNEENSKSGKMDELIVWGWSADPGMYTANLWSKYRLTREAFNKFWDEQDGKCAGCNKELAHPIWKAAKMGLKPEVDHDHRTAGDTIKVRGLLCKRCNNFMGKLKDNLETFKRLAAYLEKHQ